MAEPINYCIPKVPSQGCRTKISASSRNHQETLQTIQRSFLDSHYTFEENWTVSSVEQVLNREFQKSFQEKRQELRSELNSSDVGERFAFAIVENEGKVNDACKDGIFSGHKMLTSVSLGKRTDGVHLWMYADVPLRLAPKNIITLHIIIYKIMKGRAKLINPCVDCNLEPTPNYECHVSREVAKATAQLQQSVNNSQIFIYEYDEECLPSNRPRHCYPYAVVACSRVVDHHIGSVLQSISDVTPIDETMDVVKCKPAVMSDSSDPELIVIDEYVSKNRNQNSNKKLSCENKSQSIIIFESEQDKKLFKLKEELKKKEKALELSSLKLKNKRKSYSSNYNVDVLPKAGKKQICLAEEKQEKDHLVSLISVNEEKEGRLKSRSEQIATNKIENCLQSKKSETTKTENKLSNTVDKTALCLSSNTKVKLSSSFKGHIDKSNCLKKTRHEKSAQHVESDSKVADEFTLDTLKDHLPVNNSIVSHNLTPEIKQEFVLVHFSRKWLKKCGWSVDKMIDEPLLVMNFIRVLEWINDMAVNYRDRGMHCFNFGIVDARVLCYYLHLQQQSGNKIYKLTNQDIDKDEFGNLLTNLLVLYKFEKMPKDLIEMVDQLKLDNETTKVGETTGKVLKETIKELPNPHKVNDVDSGAGSSSYNSNDDDNESVTNSKGKNDDGTKQKTSVGTTVSCKDDHRDTFISEDKMTEIIASLKNARVGSKKRITLNIYNICSDCGMENHQTVMIESDSDSNDNSDTDCEDEDSITKLARKTTQPNLSVTKSDYNRRSTSMQEPSITKDSNNDFVSDRSVTSNSTGKIKKTEDLLQALPNKVRDELMVQSMANDIIIPLSTNYPLTQDKDVKKQSGGNTQSGTKDQRERIGQSGTKDQEEGNKLSGTKDPTVGNKQSVTTDQREENKQSGTKHQKERNKQSGTKDQKERNKQSGTKDQSVGKKVSGTKDQREGNKQSGTKDQSVGKKVSGTKDQREGNKQSGTKDQREGNKQSGTKDQSVGNKQSGTKDQREVNKQSGAKDQREGNKQSGTKDNREGNRHSDTKHQSVGIKQSCTKDHRKINKQSGAKDQREVNKESGAKDQREVNKQSCAKDQREVNKQSCAKDQREVNKQSSAKDQMEVNQQSGAKDQMEVNKQSGAKDQREVNKQSSAKDQMEVNQQSGAKDQMEVNKQSGAKDQREVNKQNGTKDQREGTKQSGAKDQIEVNKESCAKDQREVNKQSSAKDQREVNKQSGAKDQREVNKQSGAKDQREVNKQSSAKDQREGNKQSGAKDQREVNKQSVATDQREVNKQSDTKDQSVGNNKVYNKGDGSTDDKTSHMAGLKTNNLKNHSTSNNFQNKNLNDNNNNNCVSKIDVRSNKSLNFERTKSLNDQFVLDSVHSKTFYGDHNQHTSYSKYQNSYSAASVDPTKPHVLSRYCINRKRVSTDAILPTPVKKYKNQSSDRNPEQIQEYWRFNGPSHTKYSQGRVDESCVQSRQEFVGQSRSSSHNSNSRYTDDRSNNSQYVDTELYTDTNQHQNVSRYRDTERYKNSRYDDGYGDFDHMGAAASSAVNYDSQCMYYDHLPYSSADYQSQDIYYDYEDYGNDWNYEQHYYNR